MKIMIAIEDARDGYKLIDYLAARSRADDEFMLVTVVEPTPVGDYGLSIYGYDVQRQVLDTRVRTCNTWMNRIRDYLQKKLNAKHVESRVVVGTPKYTVLSIARAWHADEVVLGSHNLHGLDRFLLGSISEGVAAAAPCTVAIVK
jgi:hypothetical protein